MPKIYPFKAVHLNTAKFGEDLSKLTTQPYDKIDPQLQDAYYKQHENNLIRIILRKDEPGRDKYQDAAATLREWLKTGVLVQDPASALYVYHQVYQVPEGIRTRKGLSALVQIDEPGKGKILPHEQTHTGPKIDRFNLLSATATHTEQVFFLYSDPEKAVTAICDGVAKGKPDFQAVDEMGVTHKVWRLEDPAKIQQIQKALESKECIIADGHHRYETSWNFKQEMAKKGVKASGTETPDHVLATLVNMEDDLTIFGTHRLCYDIVGFDLAKVLTAAKKTFDIREYPFSNASEEKAARAEMLEDMKVEGLSKPCFGVAARQSQAHYLFVVRDVKSAASQVKDKRSEDWRSLDVCLLHTLILEALLGIGPKQLAEEKNVHFLRSADEAVEKVRATGPYQVAFLVNPVRLDQIKRVVKNGEKFPQKSTDFYPKLLTGLLLCKLNVS
jgi:uncharacterized protein (DUF1015 family)